ncbi:hypothetical protein PVK06_011471 [Gossypium arboreum]|uniref:Uncharacterized protein n=1 Tax=Gossypium arboreum TaxID=29729 RepID=A0ABR0Q8U3_GOSAR|nr:hypothetical protein PVK06_011471 [Gossypium arboreum]
MHVSIDEKRRGSRDIEECIQRIDCLVEGDFIIGQEEPTVKEEVTVGEEEVLATNVNKKGEEEDTEKEYAQNIVTAPKFNLMNDPSTMRSPKKRRESSPKQKAQEGGEKEEEEETSYSHICG